MKFRKVVLTGFKHCGKTFIGGLLAEKTGYSFLDIDSSIVENYRNAHGGRMGVREIYTTLGKAGFEKLEAEALARASQENRAVISLGGGSPINEAFYKGDFYNAVFVYLKVEPDVLFERIGKNGFPPFYDVGNPRKSFDKLFSERTPYYEKVADITVDNSNRHPEEVVSEILGKIGSFYAG